MRLGVVIQWASAFFELRKNVSGIQIFPTMLLLRRSTFIVLLNFSLLSYQVWAKKMSMVYSWRQTKHSSKPATVMFDFSLNAEHQIKASVCRGNPRSIQNSIVGSRCCQQIKNLRSKSTLLLPPVPTRVGSSKILFLASAKKSLCHYQRVSCWKRDHPDALSLKMKCSTVQLKSPIVWLEFYPLTF